MIVTSAVELVKALVFIPGWHISARDYSSRFEGCIAVDFVYPAQRSERELAPTYLEEVPNGARASFPIPVADLDDIGLYRAVLDRIIEIQLHEAREFLRVAPTYWAPFHPHRADGMARYGSVSSDLTFGLV